MKTIACLVFVATILAYPVYGNFADRKFDEAKYASWLEKSEFVFKGRIEIEKVEYRNRDGFALNPQPKKDPAIEKHKPKKNPAIEKHKHRAYYERDFCRKHGIRSIQYLVRFVPSSIEKGDAKDLGRLTWTFSHHILSMCPHYPHEMVFGQEVHFSIHRLSDGRAISVSVMFPKE